MTKFHVRLTLALFGAMVAFVAAADAQQDAAASSSLLEKFNAISTPAASPAASAPAAGSRRLTTRPVLSAEQYAQLAADLRTLYSKPPVEWPAPSVDPGVEHRELGPLPPVVFPEDNPYSREKEAIGKVLFFDPRLSGSGQIACASCHDPDLAWADGRQSPFGHDRAELKRNAPSLLFSAYAKPLFWDGRAKDLESQFASPIVAHDEMNAKVEVINARLNAIPEYRDLFKGAFGTEDCSLTLAARAVATFERGLAKMAGRSKFDQFLAGKSQALSDEAVRGLHLFRTAGRCINCHNGPTLSDNKFHDLGLSYYSRLYEDLGRYNVTKDPKDVGRFRTPSLRDVERTAPYMHNGFFNLDGILNAYNAGMATLIPRTEKQKSDPLFPVKDPLLKPLGLNQHDKADLKAFLESLTEPRLVVRPPKLPPQKATEPAAAAGP